MSSIVLGRPFRIASGPVLLVVTLVASAALAVQAQRNWTDPGPIVPPLPAASTPSPVPVAAPGDHGVGLVARNIFCSTCVGAVATSTSPASPRALPRLIATHLVGEGVGWATLVDPRSGAGGAYPVGADLPGGGLIAAIDRAGITVRFPDGEAVRVGFADDAPAPAAPPARVAATDPWAERVRAVGADRWEVDRRLIKELVASGAGGKVDGVRLRPVTTAAGGAGLRVVAARAGSLGQALGLEPGDVVDKVNGKAVTADEMLELYGRAGEVSRVELSIDRQGSRRTLTYDLR